MTTPEHSASNPTSRRITEQMRRLLDANGVLETVHDALDLADDQTPNRGITAHVATLRLAIRELDAVHTALDHLELDAAAAERAAETHDSPPERTPPALARLMQRLNVSSGKLDLAAAHWQRPFDVVSEDTGAVGIVKDMAREIGELYCEIADWLRRAGIVSDGPRVERYDESDREDRATVREEALGAAEAAEA